MVDEFAMFTDLLKGLDSSWIAFAALLFLIAVVVPLILKLFDKYQHSPLVPKFAPISTSENRPLGNDLESNDDVLGDYQFTATLRLRTPYHVLIHHHECHPGPRKALPTYGTRAEGIWLRQTKSYADLITEAGGDPAMAARMRRAERKIPQSQVASEIGPVPADGGDFLKFLLAFRRIIEATCSDHDKSQLLAQLLTEKPTYRTYAEKYHQDFAWNWQTTLKEKRVKKKN